MLFRLAITQLPPSASTRSWRRFIWSSSRVRLKATMTFLPLRWAPSLTTRITARTRSSKGQCGPSACSSSSLMKSMPPSTSLRTSAAVCSGFRPTLGLTMVPLDCSPAIASPARRGSSPVSSQ